LRPVGDGVKRRAHDADLKRMVVIRSPSPQLVPFKLHQFGQQRRFHPIKMYENIGEWGFIAAPISNNGQEISEGDFNATATIVSEIE
jgi:hypothetical protein